VSYTLRGRIESRLATSVFALAVASALTGVLRTWWPLELAALMTALGVTLDLFYHRALRYQPGWAALPLGLLELALLMGAARGFAVAAPLVPAIAFYAAIWIAAQVLGHALLPLWRLSYAEDGGELGLAGPGVALAAGAILAGAGGIAWVLQPPTVRLEAGIHQGPLVITRSETLVGEPGAVVRGGILVRADDVTIRGLAVLGGTNGIDVDGASDVVIDRVAIAGAELDGIHVRRSTVVIRDCSIDSAGNRYAQGIDISFTYDLEPSMVEDCTITGGQEGIVTHSAQVMVSGNHVSRTTLRGIAVTEMSMGMVEDNHVRDALGIGIYCGDRSMCEIAHNLVANTRPDRASGDLSRMGYGIVSWFESDAVLHENALVGNARGAGAFAAAKLR
jgi:nitrous oxidase accessory protein NosD